MRCYISFACVLSALVAVSLAAPLGNNDASSSAGVQGAANILGNLDIGALLQSASRILSLIRQFCPQLSEILDNVIQSVTSQLFRVVGRAILQNGGLGGGGSSGSPGKVSVVLPTFPPDDYDEDEEEEDSKDVPIDDRTSDSGATTEASPAAVSEDNNDVEGASEDSVAAKRHVRSRREAEAASEDQDTAASGGNAGPQPAEDLANVNVEDADRNKRYLPFQGAADAHAGSGGSGNFLFDIIRGTADNAARAVGTVYRMVAGTENLGIGVTATQTQTKHLVPAKAVAKPPRTTLAQLIAGSGATEEVDEKEHGAAAGGVAEIDLAKAGDGYTEGIPGPITRLFVIANRGIANLVQDLILRLAQTSERIVNFKARLITSLI